MPSSASSRPQVGDQCLASVLVDLVDVVQADEHELLVVGQGPQIPVVQRRVGVLLRIDHPDDDVGRARPGGPSPGGGRSPWSRGREDPAGSGPSSSSSVGNPASEPPRMTRCRGGMSSQVSRSSADRCPQTQASAQDVVGRRTPTAARSRPASRLYSDDLPEPVAPARATTVWSLPSVSLPAEPSSHTSASRVSSGSTRPRVSSRTSASRSARCLTPGAPATGSLTSPPPRRSGRRTAGRRVGGRRAAPVPRCRRRVRGGPPRTPRGAPRARSC